MILVLKFPCLAPNNHQQHHYQHYQHSVDQATSSDCSFADVLCLARSVILLYHLTVQIRSNSWATAASSAYVVFGAYNIDCVWEKSKMLVKSFRLIRARLTWWRWWCRALSLWILAWSLVMPFFKFLSGVSVELFEIQVILDWSRIHYAPVNCKTFVLVWYYTISL